LRKEDENEEAGEKKEFIDKLDEDTYNF
jgi:hypothetical protein